MEREVIDIVRDKEFIELTAAERAELGELCSSEDEYNQVKSMFAGMSAMNWSNPTPKVETKERLDVLFTQKYPKPAPIWYNAPLAVIAPKGKPFYRQPLVQAAAVALLLFLAYPLVNTTVMDTKSNQVAELESEMTSSKSKKSDKIVKEAAEDSDVIEANKVDEIVVDGKKDEEVFSPKPFADAPVSPTPIASVPADPAYDVALASNAIATRELELRDASIVGAAQPGSTHPDGIFKANRAEVFSAPASREPAVFDLLTSTF